jgi:hypothetical protein
MKRLRAVSDPTSILDDLEDGTLSFEAVDAAKNVYPAVFGDMQQRVMERVIELDAAGKKPKRQKLLQLGLLLGIPTLPTMQPSVIEMVQQAYAMSAPPSPPSPPQGRAPDIAKTMMTGSQELEQT